MDTLLGQLMLVPFDRIPNGWLPCDGHLLTKTDCPQLFAVLGKSFGGDGLTTCALPDLRGRAALSSGQGAGLSMYSLGQTGGSECVSLTTAQMPAHRHVLKATSQGVNAQRNVGALLADTGASAGWNVYKQGVMPDATLDTSALATAGGSQPHENRQPFLALNWVIAATVGTVPPRGEGSELDVLLGSLILVPYDYEPEGFLFCQGQLLSVSAYPSLFMLLNTTYGGNGVTTFALPDLRGRTPVSAGRNPSLSRAYELGEMAGYETVTLTAEQMPGHSHAVRGSASPANATTAAGHLLAKADKNTYFASQTQTTPVPDTQLSPATIELAGGFDAHNNLMPYQTLNWMIALKGTFPNRS